jgi:hypothetical protein
MNQFLDLANGAPLGVADYKYGLRVSVIALRSPPEWLSEKGLKMGGPRAFGFDFLLPLLNDAVMLTIYDRLDIDYKSAINLGEYERPKSVWELYRDS